MVWWLVAWGLVTVVTGVAVLLPTSSRHFHERVAEATTRLWYRLRPPRPTPAANLDRAPGSVLRHTAWSAVVRCFPCRDWLTTSTS